MVEHVIVSAPATHSRRQAEGFLELHSPLIEKDRSRNEHDNSGSRLAQKLSCGFKANARLSGTRYRLDDPHFARAIPAIQGFLLPTMQGECGASLWRRRPRIACTLLESLRVRIEAMVCGGFINCQAICNLSRESRSSQPSQ